MRKAVRIAIGSAALAIGIAAAAPANAQIRVEGSFPFPQPRISVGVGGFGFSVGTFVPPGFSVYEDADYGYGFAYGDQWIPCEQRGGRWVIIGRPVFFGRRGFRSIRPDQGYRYGFARRGQFFGPSFERDGRGFSNNRGFAQRGREFRDNRGFGREGRSTGNWQSGGRRDRGSRGFNRQSGR